MTETRPLSGRKTGAHRRDLTGVWSRQHHILPNISRVCACVCIFMCHISHLLFKQGCIFRLTCSHPELTKDQVLTSAYVKIFGTVTRNVINIISTAGALEVITVKRVSIHYIQSIHQNISVYCYSVLTFPNNPFGSLLWSSASV